MPIMPEINEDLCDGCQHCVIACPCGGFIVFKGKIKAVATVTCIYCSTCESVCPRDAIRCEYTIVLEEG